MRANPGVFGAALLIVDLEHGHDASLCGNDNVGGMLGSAAFLRQTSSLVSTPTKRTMRPGYCGEVSFVISSA